MNDKMCTVWFKDYTCDSDFKLRIGKVKSLFRSFENIKGIWLNERNKPNSTPLSSVISTSMPIAGNQLLTSEMISREALQLLHNNLTMAKITSKNYSKMYRGKYASKYRRAS